MQFSEYGTLVFGVEYIRVAVDCSFFPNSNLIDMLEMFSANRVHTFPGCFWSIRRVVFLLLHQGQRISSYGGTIASERLDVVTKFTGTICNDVAAVILKLEGAIMSGRKGLETV
jgi:hypothetical protein